MEDRANTDARKDRILNGMHRGKLSLLVIVKPNAVEYTMNDIQQQLSLKRVSTRRGLTRCFVQTDHEIGVERVGTDNFSIGNRSDLRARRVSHLFRITHVKGEHVGRPAYASKLFVSSGHREVSDYPNPNTACTIQTTASALSVREQPAQGRLGNASGFIKDVEGEFHVRRMVGRLGAGRRELERGVVGKLCRTSFTQRTEAGGVQGSGGAGVGFRWMESARLINVNPER